MKKIAEKLIRAGRYVASLKIPVYAAHTGYFMVLSVFPLLVLLLALLRYTGLAVDTLTDALEGVIPAALMPSAKKLILSTYQNSTGTVLSISALAALWSASRGMHGLVTGLNTIYHVEGVVSRSNKIGRQIVVVLNRQGNSKRQNHLRFSSKESGKILKLVREQLGNDKVVKAPTIIRTLINKFTRRKG